jgi:DNA-binding LacI/PurR family transcriptional regulator
MRPFRAQTAVEQLADYLREEIQTGRLLDRLPGVNRLAKELGVSPKTVIGAVGQLEHEGLLSGQGERKRCEIVAKAKKKRTSMRIGVWLYDEMDKMLPHHQTMMFQLQHAGHTPFHASKSMQDLGMDVERVAALVEKDQADAWIISSGSREILEWFSEQEFPSFALFGRPSGLPMAAMGARKIPAMTEAVRRLIHYGHRRIVMLAREERRKPQPALFEQAFLDELEAHGIKTGPYHLPEWEETSTGLQRSLDSLFRHTRPTALIISESSIFLSIKDYLAQKGIIAPRDISLVSDDDDIAFSWYNPEIARIRWRAEPIIKRIFEWAYKVSRGVVDIKQGHTLGEFIEGGTIGPVPKSNLQISNFK